MIERISPHIDIGYSSAEDEEARRLEIKAATENAPVARGRNLGRTATRSEKRSSRRDADYAGERNTGVPNPNPSPDQLPRVFTNNAAALELTHHITLASIRKKAEARGDSEHVILGLLRTAEERARRQTRKSQDPQEEAS